MLDLDVRMETSVRRGRKEGRDSLALPTPNKRRTTSMLIKNERTESLSPSSKQRTFVARQEEDKERGGGGGEDDTSGVGVMSTHANTVAERTIVAEETPAVVERPKLSIYDDWEGDDDDDFGGVI